MGGRHLDALARARLDPTNKGAAAWKDERMRSVAIDDRQFQVLIVGRSGNRLPHGRLSTEPDAKALMPSA